MDQRVLAATSILKCSSLVCLSSKILVAFFSWADIVFHGLFYYALAIPVLSNVQVLPWCSHLKWLLTVRHSSILLLFPLCSLCNPHVISHLNWIHIWNNCRWLYYIHLLTANSGWLDVYIISPTQAVAWVSYVVAFIAFGWQAQNEPTMNFPVKLVSQDMKQETWSINGPRTKSLGLLCLLW